MDRIIVVGANGVGKSHFAARLGLVRPDVPIISFDAIKLTTNWQQRRQTETSVLLANEINKPAWILEGGPSLLFQAVETADALVWLDPPNHVRVRQLATRPWKFPGKTRPEMPEGNVDWPFQQYRFAFRSLKNSSKFRSAISEVYKNVSSIKKWHCRNEKDRRKVIEAWAESAECLSPPPAVSD